MPESERPFKQRIKTIYRVTLLNGLVNELNSFDDFEDEDNIGSKKIIRFVIPIIIRETV